MSRETKLLGVLDFLFLVFALGAFAINLLLLSRGLDRTASSIAGCGGGSCDELLASNWSVIFGIPVTAFGVAVWFAVMASSTHHFRRAHHPLLGVVVGAAAWFVFVQAVILKSFCLWCMAAHGFGIAAVVIGLFRQSSNHGLARSLKLMGVWSMAAFLATGLVQVYGPVPIAYRIDGEITAAPASRAGVEENERIVFFDDGRKSYQVDMLPRLGRADAPHILIEYFDYQCAACRTMAGYVEALVAKHPEGIAVLFLPVPLESSCNDHVPVGGEHPGSCGIARISLAVWRVKPAAFAGFHRSLIANPSEDTARRLASEVMPPERLTAALADPWIEERIRENVTDWRTLSKSTDKLPKLLIRDRRILHGLPSGEADFIHVMEQELGL